MPQACPYPHSSYNTHSSTPTRTPHTCAGGIRVVAHAVIGVEWGLCSQLLSVCHTVQLWNSSTQSSFGYLACLVQHSAHSAYPLSLTHMPPGVPAVWLQSNPLTATLCTALWVLQQPKVRVFHSDTYLTPSHSHGHTPHTIALPHYHALTLSHSHTITLTPQALPAALPLADRSMLPSGGKHERHAAGNQPPAAGGLPAGAAERGRRGHSAGPAEGGRWDWQFDECILSPAVCLWSSSWSNFDKHLVGHFVNKNISTSTTMMKLRNGFFNW